MKIRLNLTLQILFSALVVLLLTSQGEAAEKIGKVKKRKTKTAVTAPVDVATEAELAADAAEASGPKKTAGRYVCQSGERWTYSPAIRPDFVKDFERTLSKSTKPVRGFSDAMSLRRLAQDQEAKIFAEYWISRALLNSDLPHVAFLGFGSIASRPLTPETAGVQLAALDCMVQIHYQHPSIELTPEVMARIHEYRIHAGESRHAKKVVFEAASAHLNSLIAQGADDTEMNKFFDVLKGSGAYEPFAMAMRAARRNDHRTTIREMEKFFASKVIPQPLRHYVDAAHISAARAYYTVGQFNQAAIHFKQVSRSSNEMANSLSELSWAYLLDEKYPEAIGTAMSLQAGGMRKTYAPEAPMVMAMALNEICQYPEAVQASILYRKLYQSTYKWLANWNNAPEKPSLYPQAVRFLKKVGTVPERIASDWVRSPQFISSQDEINVLLDEKDGTAKLSRSGSREQQGLGKEVLRLSRELKPRLKIAKMKRKADQELPQSIRRDLAHLSNQVTQFRRLQLAAPVWRLILSNFQQKAAPRQKELMARIETDLNSRTQKMFRQLEEIAENIQLIEVEIYNGASQDIIWQNAHPDYKEVAQNMKEEKEKVAPNKVWNWGRAPAGLMDETSEIWEDELGSFKANLFDNCSSKDRYLAIKKEHVQAAPVAVQESTGE